jgi:ecotin
MRTVWLAVFAFLVFVVPELQAADNLKAFDPAENGMVRYVLQLPAENEEENFRVELIVGKMVQVDEKNRYFFGGQLEEEVVEGWGFTQYRLTDLGPMGGTLMAVDPSAAKVSRFVSLGGDPYFIRYNSRLPIVVYVPEGVEVRYRIWTAAPEMVALEKG